MTSIKTETETVIKKILPYLRRRGYDVEKDLDFETGVQIASRTTKGYVDILATCGKSKPLFVIEAKKSSKRLDAKDRDQAIAYGQALAVPFVVITNGTTIECYNTHNKALIRWNGKLAERIPTKTQLSSVATALRVNKDDNDVPLGNDKSLPFRPGLPLKQLNALFARCHDAIRKIEKNEESAFADFSKLLFLKLLEEKADLSNDFLLPYSYRFHELAAKPDVESDQIRDAVGQMIESIRRQSDYGDVLGDKLRLTRPQAFKYIVTQLASVSFHDSSLDAKGAAFEYFVRATLKGKRLGQYFTPRQLVKVMHHMVGHQKIVNAVMSGAGIKVLDPACGTGGFLVFMLQDSIEKLEGLLRGKKITKKAFDTVSAKLMGDVFFGADANDGVACAAKMNMIVAGDGHTNIRHEDSLSASSKSWRLDKADCDIIVTNPPFGTSEKASLSVAELALYPIKSTKGQILFLQKMVLSTVAGGDICTVIDEGVLNTESAKELRSWLFKKCEVLAVVRLSDDTFKPNKINVRSSVLHLRRRNEDDEELELDYKITLCHIHSLGYDGSGAPIRGFEFQKLLSEISSNAFDANAGAERTGYSWSAFDVSAQEMIKDAHCRLDHRYWRPGIRQRLEQIRKNAGKTIKDLNTIKTRRGKSPAMELYVDADDGHALVVKAGTNISKYGKLISSGDYIEKNIFDEMTTSQVQDGDILLASTGDGTLGKCCVYRDKGAAIADSHVTVIRVDPKVILPEYLCDYLRQGFGAEQIERVYTGATGLIELTPEHVDSVVVDLLGSVDNQKCASDKLRDAERRYIEVGQDNSEKLGAARRDFLAC